MPPSLLRRLTTKTLALFSSPKKGQTKMMPGPPQVDRPNEEIYARMGEENIYLMLEDFYIELGKSSIKNMFPGDLKASSEKSAAFFVGLCGGPPLYHQRYGNPMLRRRHMPFAIDEHAKDEWLRCFESILQEAPSKYNFPAEHIQGFRDFLNGFSPWMMNR
jgi:hemoglobin